MRSHFILLQASCYYFALLLPFILGVSGQTGVTSPPPSSSSSSSTPSSSPSSGGSSLSSSTSGVSLGVTGTPTGTADFPTLSGYSECVTDCFANAVASSNCPSLTASDCYCNSTNVEGFEQSIISCLTGNCPQELLTGEQLAQRFCIVGPSGTSISFPPPPSSLSSVLSSLSTPSSSSTSSSSTPTQTPGNSSSNGASSWESTWGAGGSTVVFGILVGLASILVGSASW